MSVSSEFVLRPIQTGRGGNGPPNEESQPSKKEEEGDEECETPKGEGSRIASALASCPDPPRKRRCVVIGKRTIPQIETITVEKEEMDRLFVRRDPVGCGMSVKSGSKRKRCSVSDEC
jgi:hypothetical protein